MIYRDKKLILVVIIVIIAVVMSSCSLFLGTSIEDRIQQFEDDLNKIDRTGIWDNFHSDCDLLTAISTVDYWNTDAFFFDNIRIPFSIPTPSSGDEDFTLTVNNNAGSASIRFEMKNEGNFMIGDDWRIDKLWIGGTIEIY